MPYYVALGASKIEVLESTPLELEYYSEAQRIRDEINDVRDWRLGQYIESAVATAVEHNLAGKKAKSKYIEKPLLEMAKEVKEEVKMTDSQRKLQVKAFFASLQTLQSNFELEKQQNSK